ncbi:MAG TPA: DUF1698 domain-containing protein [Pyrinomonadaceae bacterium]
MTSEEIQKQLDSLAPWFHCIDLGNGIKTKTRSAATEPVDHPAATWQKISQCLPAELSGKSVLDVGCNAGFYAIEAKRRNALRVVGVDAQRHHVRQALFVRRLLGLDIEYRRMSVYDLSRSTVGQFDITLALGLIYHCKHLILALERLFEVTKEMLILETAILPLEKTPKSFVDKSSGGDATLHPLVFAENPPEMKEPTFNWFLPSVKALNALLLNVGFDVVEKFEVQRHRAILICRKNHSSLHGRVLSQLGATLTLVEGPAVCEPQASLKFRLFAENTGGVSWSTAGSEGERGVVRLGAHLLDEYGEEVNWDFGRASLTRDVEPDDAVSLSIELTAPVMVGKYIVEFDLVLEHITWFEDLGTATIRQSLLVTNPHLNE